MINIKLLEDTNEDEKIIEEEISCNICMNDIFENDELADVKNEDEFDLKSKLFRNLCKRYKNDYRMQTPCQHFFHTSNLFKNIFIITNKVAS